VADAVIEAGPGLDHQFMTLRAPAVSQVEHGEHANHM